MRHSWLFHSFSGYLYWASLGRLLNFRNSVRTSGQNCFLSQITPSEVMLVGVGVYGRERTSTFIQSFVVITLWNIMDLLEITWKKNFEEFPRRLSWQIIMIMMTDDISDINLCVLCRLFSSSNTVAWHFFSLDRCDCVEMILPYISQWLVAYVWIQGVLFHSLTGRFPVYSVC